MDSVSKVELSSKVTVVVRNGLVSIVADVAAIGAFASVDPLVNPEMGWPLKDLATLGTAPVILPLIVVLEFDVDPDGSPAHEAEACQSSKQPRLVGHEVPGSGLLGLLVLLVVGETLPGHSGEEDKQ